MHEAFSELDRVPLVKALQQYFTNRAIDMSPGTLSDQKQRRCPTCGGSGYVAESTGCPHIFLRLFEHIPDFEDEDEEEDGQQEGWWISPKGEENQLDDKDHHQRFAARTLEAEGVHMEYGAAMAEFFKRGWVRLALEGRELWVEHDPRWSLTPTQIRTIREIAEGWGAEVQNDGGNLFRANARGSTRPINPASWIKKLDGD